MSKRPFDVSEMSGVPQDMSHANMSTSAHPARRAAEATDRFAMVLLGASQPVARIIDGPVLIGRATTCDLSVPNDTAASREHLQLAPAPGGVKVTDLESRNGVFVNGVRVRSSTVVNSGILRFGDTVARITTAPGAENPPRVNDDILVGGASLAAARRIAGLVGPTDLAVLVTGETGTGKEVVARLFHQLSQRPGPLVPVNCAALPEQLLESELFGHVKGAFTGATAPRRGLVAAAEGGTLFLDEVGELPLAAQAKLLRVLEDRVVRPVGASAGPAAAVDFRVISATNVDLRAAVERGAFRSDLFARLAAVEVTLPPLRDRIEDLPLLVAHLASRRGARYDISADALEALARHGWPQNVRELDHVLRRAAALASGAIGLEDLPEMMQRDFRALSKDTGPINLDPLGVSRRQLEDALRSHGGNVKKVGQSLRIPRSRLYRLITKWAIDPEKFRAHRRAGTATANREDTP